MAIAFVDAGAQAAGITDPLTPSLPTHSEGDLLLIFVWARIITSGFVPDAITAAGYVQIGVAQNGAQVVLAKFAGASESDPSVTTDFNIGGGWCAQMAAYSGVDARIIDHGALYIRQLAVATTQTGEAIDAGTDGALAISFAVTPDDNALEFAAGSDQGFTARMSGAAYSSVEGGDMSVGMADKMIASAHTTVTAPTWEQTAGGPDEFQTITFSLMPDGAVPDRPIFRGTSALAIAAATSPLSVPFPAPVAANDLIVVHASSNNRTSVTTATDYTEFGSSAGSVNGYTALLYKVAAGSETSVSVANTVPGNGWLVAVSLFGNVDPADPWDSAPVVDTEDTVASYTGGPVTPDNDNAGIVAAVGIPNDVAFVFSSSESFVMISNYFTAVANDVSLAAGYKTIGAAAATATPTWADNLGTSQNWVSVVGALRAADAPTPPPSGGGNRMGGTGAIRKSPRGRSGR